MGSSRCWAGGRCPAGRWSSGNRSITRCAAKCWKRRAWCWSHEAWLKCSSAYCATGRAQPTSRGAAIRVDFSGIPDVEPAVQKLHIEGAGLEPREIYELFTLLDVAADAKSNLTAAAQRFPLLGKRAQAIGDFRALLR